MPSALEQRLDLHEKLVSILGDPKHVYFQPPESVKLDYPCIIYRLTNFFKRYADNGRYISCRRYEITLITKDPDNDLVDKLVELPYCTFDRYFVSENLNHYIFLLYHDGKLTEEV